MAAAKFRDAGNTLRTVSAFKMRDAGGTLRTAVTIKMRDAANVLRTVFEAGGGSGGLALTPAYAQGYGASAGTITVSSNSVYITNVPAGATIVWHIDNPSIVIVTPSASSTIFRATLGSGTSESGTAYATVNGVNTATIQVDLTNGGTA